MNLRRSIDKMTPQYKEKQLIILSLNPSTSTTDDIIDEFYLRKLTAPIHPSLLDILYEDYMRDEEFNGEELPTCILIALTYTTGRNHGGDLSRDNLLFILRGDEPILYQASSDNLFVDEYILK